MTYMQDYSEQIAKLKNGIEACDAVLLDAGAGLSTSAGLTYSGGFYPYEDSRTNCTQYENFVSITARRSLQKKSKSNI